MIFISKYIELSNVDSFCSQLMQRLKNSDNLNDLGLYKRLNSYQFKISQSILGERISQGLTPKEAAAKCHLSESEYRLFENGINMEATQDEYRNIYDRLRRSVDDDS